MFVVHLTVEQAEAAPFFPLEMFVGSLYVGSWWIMDYGCNIHTTDIQGNTALMIAAQHGALRCTHDCCRQYGEATDKFYCASPLRFLVDRGEC